MVGKIGKTIPIAPSTTQIVPAISQSALTSFCPLSFKVARLEAFSSTLISSLLNRHLVNLKNHVLKEWNACYLHFCGEFYNLVIT